MRHHVGQSDGDSVRRFVTALLGMTLCLTLVGCIGNTQEPTPTRVEPRFWKSAKALAARTNLPLSGDVRSRDATIPASLELFPWLYIQQASKQGGFDLTEYVNQRVTLYTYDTLEPSGDGHGELCLIVHKGKVVGAYKTTQGAVPGVSGVGAPPD